jgi:hypothetical protein
MADKAARYAKIVVGNTNDAQLNEVLADVSTLGAQSLYPAILSADLSWPATTSAEKQAIRQYASALITGYFRHVSIGDREGTKLETLLYEQAKQITAGQLLATSAVAQIKGFVPDDIDFKRDFESKNVSGALARYILRKIDDDLRGPDTAMKVAEPRTTHVEHVDTQSPLLKWPDHDEWVDRIGNITLLSGSVNRSLSNAEYAVKRPRYLKSDVKMTERLAIDYECWTSVEIASRQAKLAARAAEIWSFH